MLLKITESKNLRNGENKTELENECSVDYALCNRNPLLHTGMNLTSKSPFISTAATLSK